jgi:hypothetical protein
MVDAFTHARWWSLSNWRDRNILTPRSTPKIAASNKSPQDDSVSPAATSPKPKKSKSKWLKEPNQAKADNCQVKSLSLESQSPPVGYRLPTVGYANESLSDKLGTQSKTTMLRSNHKFLCSHSTLETLLYPYENSRYGQRVIRSNRTI